MTGDIDGVVTLKDLIAYIEITSGAGFIDASRWLSANLKDNETALVPTSGVFVTTNPELKDKLLDYHFLWTASGIFLWGNTAIDEVMKVRNYFVNFLKENTQVKYVVRDWVYRYAERLYEVTVNDELMLLLREVEVIPSRLVGNWTRILTIYERVQYTTLFAMNLSSPPEQYHTIPSDAHIQFGSNGTMIQKVGPRVGFYLPLEVVINASRQNYLTMQVKLDLENLDLLVVFYYDKNGDGKFSGFEIDYAKSVSFNQTKLGWVKGKWYKIAQTIPNADDPVVQIGIIMTGDIDGVVTLKDLTVYTQTASEV